MKKLISNEEFEQIWHNTDNKSILYNVMNHFARRYERSHATKVCRKHLYANGQYVMWQAATSYKPDHDSKTKFTTFLHTVASNWCKYYFGKLHKTSEKEVGLDAVLFEKFETNSSIDEREFVREILEKLPPSDKNILYQRFFDGKTLKEIGDTEGYSAERARQKIDQILNNLREVYKDVT